MELDDFIANHQKRSSIFTQFQKDIFYMLERNVSQVDIIKYLKSKIKSNKKGLTQANLSKWLKRQNENTLEKKSENALQVSEPEKQEVVKNDDYNPGALLEAVGILK